ncbi:nucleotidyltransferase [Spirochaetia bacterium]|nr:nucleotidyltransferase [Spirochaetia bacterium]
MNENTEVNKLINEFCNFNEVQAIALGGSRATERSDTKSDYDFYIYLERNLNSEIRYKILSNYCSIIEVGNNYWELEDNCKLNNGIDIDIIYRDLYQITKNIADVVENGNSYNGFTTCLWHNILTSKIIYDKNNILKKTKERFSIPYPNKLKENIIKRNMTLLSGSLVSYDKQIIKNIKRNDMVNLNNRITAFLASYFDIIFAINELPNPGEKRLVEISIKECRILPNGFENNINSLFHCINNDKLNTIDIIETIVCELKKIL